MEFEDVARVQVPDEVHQAGSSEQTGFPSPATHYLESRIDLNRILTRNRDATFFIRVKGDGYREFQINNGDVLIVDRSMVASRGKLAVVVKDGEFKIVKFNRNQTSGETEEQLLWGVITYVIHQI